MRPRNGSRSAFPAVPFLLVVLAAGSAFTPRSAVALPPYAEEWTTPGQPEDVDVDQYGRVWVSCSDDSVRVYTPSGGHVLFAFGGSGIGPGEFNDPFGIQFAPDGTVYICDYAGARVQRFTSEGVYMTSWAIPSDRADHVAIDAAGDVYVSGYSNETVHKYTATGTPITSWTTTPGRPSGVFVVGNTLHVAPWFVTDVQQYDLDGNYLGSFPSDTEYGVDIEEDATGQLWLADWINHVVKIYTAGGVPVDVLGEPGFGPGQFNYPIGIGFGLDGSVYVADQGNVRVQRFGDPITSVGEPAARDTRAVTLRSITPNPARGAVAFTYALPRAGRVVVSVADAGGRVVARMDQGVVDAGEHRVVWDAQSADGERLAGLYFVRVETESGTSVGRLAVMR